MDPQPSPRAPVEEVRETLRSLGYLDSGLDRFVLAGTGGASPVRASAAVALRVGVAGGALLGAALTIAAVWLDRRLLQEPQDLAVLALYLVVATGVLTAIAAFATGLAAAGVVRRLGRAPGPGLARNFGLAVGLTGLAYVALWWRSHAAGSGLLFQGGVLALGLGLGVVLGRFGALAAVAVLSTAGAGESLPAASLSRRRMLPLLGAAALLLGGSVAAASYLADRAAEGPDFVAVPTGLRVRVLGIDGLERRMAEQQIGRGEMPHLAGLLASGARARLRAEPERVPAIVWTTLATGRGPEAHGIHAIGSRRLAGMRNPVSGDAERSPFVSALASAGDLLRITRKAPPSSVLRSVKTFWNVASEKGLRVGVVNWWATWPADPVTGYLVSDRAFFKLERGEALDREVHPPESWERLRSLLPPASEERARRIDGFAAAASLGLRESARPDLEAVYLPGLDIVTSQLLGDSGSADLASLDARLDAIRAYHRFVDDLIGRMAAGLGPQDVLVLAGDPGRLARRGPEEAEGLLVLAGGPVVAGDLGVASERDVAPTVLHLVGLPVSRELDGRVLEAALDDPFRRRHPLRTVDTYGRRPAARRAESAFDREMLEALRGLGYLE